MRKTIGLTADAKSNNAFTHRDGTIFIDTNINEQQSHFLFPHLSRWIMIPDSAWGVLKEQSNRMPDSKKVYPRYRGYWKTCPSCKTSESCGALYIKGSDVFVAHCVVNKNYNFGVCDVRQFHSNVRVVFLGDEKVGELWNDTDQ
jgi:hypothetical protein